jgi:hypothetical protein
MSELINVPFAKVRFLTALSRFVDTDSQAAESRTTGINEFIFGTSEITGEEKRLRLGESS